MNLCHVCRKHEATVPMKCKLDCDGVPQEFCERCATLYREFQDTYSEDPQTANDVLKELQARHHAGVKFINEKVDCQKCLDSGEVLVPYWKPGENGPVEKTTSQACPDCCPHHEHDHFVCLDCGKELDPGAFIDRAMDRWEDR